MMLNTSSTMTAYSHRATRISTATDRWLPTAGRLLAVVLGALHTCAAIISYSMSEDGINYLDIGDAYMRGDWNAALNSVWSPLYSWILGPVMRLVRPSIRWEFAVVQVVNLAIYLGALVCFEFFWRQLTRYRRSAQAGAGPDQVALPEWAWGALGYALFIWSSLTLIKIWVVTPDMLMACFVYLAAALVVRIRLSHTGWLTFGLLGAILGLAYLAKAVMFPMAFVFLVAGLFSAGHMRRALPRTLVALLTFLLISGPYVGAISASKGRLTIGDAGTLTYVWYVNGVPYPHWQGGPPGSGTPEHPSRKVFDNPPIYEFGTPVGGTYPISYDPAYWYEGVVAHVDVGQQLVLFLRSALFYFDLFLRQQGVLVAAVLITYWMGSRRRLRGQDIVRGWGLVLIALAALGMYGLVYAESRYVGVFVVLFWADWLANVSLPRLPVSKRLAAGLGATMVVFVLASILAFNLEGFGDLTNRRSAGQATSQPAGPPSWPGEVAQELHRLGIRQGDSVGVIGYGFGAFWARLARVRIVAEMLGHEAAPFWLGDRGAQAAGIEAFVEAGARAIVAEDVPAYATLSGWLRVGDSSTYIYVQGD